MNRLLLTLLLTAAPAVFALDQQLADALRQQFGSQRSSAIITQLNAAEQQGLPLAALENKVREGLAKRAPAEAIARAVEQRRAHLATVVSRGNAAPVAVNRALFTIEHQATLAATSGKPSPDKVQLSKPAHQRVVAGQESEDQTLRKAAAPRKLPAVRASVAPSPSVTEGVKEPKKVTDDPLVKPDKQDGAEKQAAKLEEKEDKAVEKALEKQEKAIEKAQDKQEKAIEKALQKQEKALDKQEKAIEKALEKRQKALDKL